jgi:hypothetical protein
MAGGSASLLARRCREEDASGRLTEHRRCSMVGAVDPEREERPDVETWEVDDNGPLAATSN